MTETSSLEKPATIPTAIVQPKRSPTSISRLWWITIVAVLAAAGLTLASLKSTGPMITIRFADGFGLKAGDLLKFRGIAIGEVTDVVLTTDRNRVAVRVRLDPKAAPIARRGSLFWIERPRVSLSRVSGLETVVGPKHLGVAPAALSEPVATEFEGLDSPPTLAADGSQESVEISIRFHEGHGLQVGDPLRHHGIAVGEVTAVNLSDELSAIEVRVRLSGESRRLAREGTQFWIERPRVSVAEVRGLDTLVGGRYLAALPGPIDAQVQTEFEGLDGVTPTEVPEGALEIVLNAPQRWGVDRGVAVTYRGLRVGQIVSVGLSADGTRVEARAYIEGRHRSLVRDNSVFWSTSGIDLNMGIRGIQVSAETLSSIALGGVAFATPLEPGRTVSTGRQFSYVKTPRDEWLNWQPRIAAADAVRRDHAPLCQPLRAAAHWGERSYGISRNRERTGWVVWLDNGDLIGPADLLQPTTSAKSKATLESHGQEFPLLAEAVQTHGLLATFHPMNAPTDEVVHWPVKRIRSTAEPEDCLVVTDSQSEPLPITATSLQSRGQVWDVRGTAGLSPDHHGAAVVSIKDGQLIGILLFQKGKATIATIDSIAN